MKEYEYKMITFNQMVILYTIIVSIGLSIINLIMLLIINDRTSYMQKDVNPNSNYSTQLLLESDQ